MAFDEFNKLDKEDNISGINEFQVFEPVEYFKVNENIRPLDDNAEPPEDLINAQHSSGRIDKHSGESLKEEQERIEKLTNSSGSSSSSSSSSQSSATGESGAQASADAASTTTTTAASTAGGGATATASVASTTASIAGGSLVTALAAATVAIAGTFAKAPKLVFENYEAGTDYIKFEMLFKELEENKDYFVRVTSGKYSLEFPITDNETMSEILSDLTPNREYTFTVFSKNGDLGEYTYFTKSVYTSKYEQPESAFIVKPNVNFEDGIYSVDYNVLISDHFNVAFDTYLEISVEGRAVTYDTNLGDDGYFIGTISELEDNTNISIKAYTTYYDELTLIGEYLFKTSYPEGFVSHEDRYEASYTFSSDTVTYVKDAASGFKVNYDLAFNNTKDSRDKYKISFYTSDKELIEEVISDSSTGTVTIPFKYTGKVDVVFTPIKEKEDETITFEPTTIFLNLVDNYEATYTYDEESLSYVKNVEDGFKVSYNLGFTNESDPRDKYKLSFYTSDNTLIDEIISNSATGTVDIPLEYGGRIKVILTPIKVRDDDTTITYDPITHTLDLDLIYSNFEVNFNSNSYFLMCSRDPDTEGEYGETLLANITEYYSDGTNETLTGREISHLEEERFNYVNPQKAEEITKIVIEVMYKEKPVQTIIIDTDITATLGDYEIDSDAFINVPYELSMPTDSTLYELMLASHDGGKFDYVDLLNDDALLEGIFKIGTISDSVLDPELYITYTSKEGVKINLTKHFDEIDLNASVQVNYYASYESSVYYANLDFKTTVDGVVKGGLPLNVEILQLDGTYKALTDFENKNGEYYAIEINQVTNNAPAPSGWVITYRITDSLYGNQNEDQYIVFSSEVYEKFMMYDNQVSEYSYSMDAKYLPTKNSNGTVNLNVLSNFEMNEGIENLYYRIEYSYFQDAKWHYQYSPYLTSKTHVVENISDKTYNIRIGVFYKDGDDYYLIKYHDVKELEGSDELDLNTDVVQGSEGDNFTVAQFDLNYKNVDRTKNGFITIGENTYAIEFKDVSDPSVAVEVENESYKYEYTDPNEVYSYEVSIFLRNGNPDSYSVLIRINDYSEDGATLTYPFTPNELIDNFDGVDFSEFTKNVECSLMTYRGDYNITDVENRIDIRFSEDYPYKFEVLINGITFNSADSRDTLLFEFYDTEGNLFYSEAIKSYGTIEFGSYYKNVVLKVKEVKDLREEYYEYRTVLTKNLDFSEYSSVTVDSSEASFPGDPSISNMYAVSVTLGSEYSASNYKLVITEYYQDGSTNVVDPSLEKTDNNMAATIDHSTDGFNVADIEKVKVEVYYDYYGTSYLVDVIEKNNN